MSFTFTIPRPSNVPLVFDGELLVSHSSKDEHPHAQRWQEITIYRTDTGKWVTAVIGRTIVDGEKDRVNVNVCETPDEVLQGVSREQDGRTFVTNMGYRALREAAQRDPELIPATQERI